MAGLFLLHKAGHPAAIDLAMRLAPETDWETLAPKDDDTAEGAVVPFDAARARRAFFEAKAGAGDGLPRLLAAARDAARKVSRQGLDDCALAAPRTDALADQLIALSDGLAAARRFVDSDTPGTDWPRAFAREREMFAATFAEIYAAPAAPEMTYAAR